MDWFKGAHVDNSVLWGLKILWWGRIGKGAEFLAATVIVMEILGPERVRAFGRSLRPVAADKLIEWLAGRWILHLVFIVAGLTICFLFLVQIRIWVETAPALASVSMIVFFALVIGLLFLWIWSITALGRVAAVVFNTVATTLRFPLLDKVVKLAALFLLLFGFHFDLLSS